MIATETQNETDLIRRQCKGLVDTIARKRLAVKLLIGVNRWLLDVLLTQAGELSNRVLAALAIQLLDAIASTPKADSLLPQIRRVLQMYAAYKRN